MPITLNDFKEGGALRQYVTKIGLLDQIDNGTLSEEELLARLNDSVTISGKEEIVEEAHEKEPSDADSEEDKPSTYTAKIYVSCNVEGDGISVSANPNGEVTKNVGETIDVELEVTFNSKFNKFMKWMFSNDGENYQEIEGDIITTDSITTGGNYYYKAILGEAGRGVPTINDNPEDDLNNDLPEPDDNDLDDDNNK